MSGLFVRPWLYSSPPRNTFPISLLPPNDWLYETYRPWLEWPYSRPWLPLSKNMRRRHLCSKLRTQTVLQSKSCVVTHTQGYIFHSSTPSVAPSTHPPTLDPPNHNHDMYTELKRRRRGLLWTEIVRVLNVWTRLIRTVLSETQEWGEQERTTAQRQRGNGRQRPPRGGHVP